MKTLAVLQARMSSRRLPGKVLMPILGRPMLLRQIDRIRRASSLDGLVVATSADPSDDPIERMCRAASVEVFRGSLDDVLDRFHAACGLYQPENVVRLTGDCPLIDPDVIDRVVRRHFDGGFDYTSNWNPATFPDGLDCEIMTRSALTSAWRNATDPFDREHVTPYLYRQSGRFRVGHVANDTDLSMWRWTVDAPIDFAIILAIFAMLLPEKPDFGMADIVALAQRRPELFRDHLAIPRETTEARP